MKQNDKPIIVEQTYDSALETVWKSITEIDQMRRWFFENIPEFEPRVGFETRFNVDCDGKDFLHLWRVTEVEPNKKIAYTWKYDGYQGVAIVMFELSKHEKLTKLTLTFSVRERFPEDIPEFSRESGIAGWEYFISKSLKDYLEGKH